MNHHYYLDHCRLPGSFERQAVKTKSCRTSFVRESRWNKRLFHLLSFINTALIIPYSEGLTQRETNLLKEKKMQGHYWGNDSASQVRPHTGKDEFCALMKAVASGMKTFNIKCTLKSDVAIEMNGYKIRQVSKVPGLTLLLGEMIIGWELYLSKDGALLILRLLITYNKTNRTTFALQSEMRLHFWSDWKIGQNARLGKKRE